MSTVGLWGGVQEGLWGGLHQRSSRRWLLTIVGLASSGLTELAMLHTGGRAHQMTQASMHKLLFSCVGISD